MHNPFRYFNNSPEVIRFAVVMYIRYPSSLRQIEGLLSDRDIEICHDTVRFCWNRFAPMLAAELRNLWKPFDAHQCCACGVAVG